jgi:hypothetical protein
MIRRKKPRLVLHTQITSGGRHSEACLRRTENPPWVLVSEAVKTLQKEWTVGLGGSDGHGSGLVVSICYSISTIFKAI